MEEDISCCLAGDPLFSADGAAAEMLVMMDDEAVEWCKTGMELFLFEGGHLNGAGCLI